jgi:ketosteroid isomerase-like protein
MFQFSYPSTHVDAQTRQPVEVVMPRWVLVIALASGACLVPACAGSTGTSSPVEAEEPRVREVLNTYLRSIDGADVTLASEVWAQSPAVEAVTPLGRFKGWNAVRDGLYINFLQKSFSERHLTPSDVSVRVVGDAAWAVFDWAFAAKRTGGQPFMSRGWESHVYQRVNGRWALVQLHYSAPVQPQ